MTKKKALRSSKFIEIADLKNNRFKFVKNRILRENIAIKMQYIVFLLSLEQEYRLPGAISYSTFKTVIIYTASIVESLIHYKIDELIKEKRIKKEQTEKSEEKYKEKKILYKISAQAAICSFKVIKKNKQLSSQAKFIHLNRIAKKIGLFNKNLFENAEKIRADRNKIHPYTLKQVDDQYTKADIQNLFSRTTSIINRIENF